MTLDITRPEPTLFEKSRPGRMGVTLPPPDVPEAYLPEEFLRPELTLPEVGERDLVSHYVRLSRKNYGVDLGFYPLGSCTMKYNPKVNEQAARLPGFAHIHPLQSPETVPGALELMVSLQEMLAAISGFHSVTLQPAAGAQGELTGVLAIRSYLEDHGEGSRDIILVPDSAHGTNPATASMAGMRAVEIASDEDGNTDLRSLQAALDQYAGRIAGLMITNPNTLGLFEEHIEEICRRIHEAGGLVYGDGANLNAILGILRPADVGIDIMHFNLHKTFSTPHGGGGPGAGPVGCVAQLAPYLPGPRPVRQGEGGYAWEMPAKSIGRVRSFWGNFGILVRAYTYIRMHGAEGLREIAENAVLNANYLMQRIQKTYAVPFGHRTCMHEFVAQAKVAGVGKFHALDVAKRLIDLDHAHPPTVYFPLIVAEALMIEPTETESKETLDQFVADMEQIAREARDNPELLQTAPHRAPLRRLDEVKAARQPILRHEG
jgi:glycine dehydrogenase subunit 2